MSELIYDVGVCDGADTEYYLRRGYDVLGIEANPRMIAALSARFAREIAQGRLTLLNLGVAEHDGSLTFWISDVAEWSSFDRSIASRNGTRHEAVAVPTRRFDAILAEYGTPAFCKIDIEGNDWLCLAAMTPATAPREISLEMCHSGGERDLGLLRALGYTQFKIISQVTRAQPFKPITALAHVLPGRSKGALRRVVKYSCGTWRANGWTFPANSSGAFGRDAPGPWRSYDHALSTWRFLRALDLEHDAGGLGEWFDIHARRPSS